MKRMTHWIVAGVTASLLLLSSAVFADFEHLSAPLPAAKSPATNDNYVPPPPSVDADSYVIMATGSGKVLGAKDPDKRLPPASLTKMMTLYVVSETLKTGQIKLDDKVRVSRTAWKAEGSRMFLKEGQEVTVKELLQGIIVQSGNDACIAIAEFIAGSEEAFVALMNEEAKRLGMNNTHFTDCTGMPHENHYSTALDLTILAHALVTHYPDFYPWYSQKWFTFNDIKQPNRNRLLWRYQYADGIKTGHTKEAGYCLAASAKKDDMRLVAVLMGAHSDQARSDSMQRLLTYGFRFYHTYKLYEGDTAISEAKVWKGAQDQLPVGIANDLIVTIPSGQYNHLKVATAVTEPLTAPVAEGQEVGKLSVTLGGESIVEAPLVALSSVKQGGLWTRMTDGISLSVRNFFHSKANDEDAEQG